MNFKKIMLGSAFVMAASSFFACGDDSTANSDPVPGEESSSSTPLEIPENSDVTPIRFENFKGQLAGSRFIFSGMISLDVMDKGLDSALIGNIDAFRFTDVQFVVGRIQGDQFVQSSATVKFEKPALPTNARLSINEMGAAIDFSDPNFTDCGEYQLMVTAFAEDAKGGTYTTTGYSEKFSRPETYCAASQPVSSSAVVVQEIEMDFYEVTLESNGKKGLNLATAASFTDAEIAAGAAVDFTLDNVVGEIRMNAKTGVAFAPIINGDDNINFSDDWCVGFYPETQMGRSAYVSDFKYRTVEATQIDPLDQPLNIYVVKTSAYNEATGAGFFAIAMTDSQELTNKDFSMTFKVYKVK